MYTYLRLHTGVHDIRAYRITYLKLSNSPEHGSECPGKVSTLRTLCFERIARLAVNIVQLRCQHENVEEFTV